MSSVHVGLSSSNLAPNGPESATHAYFLANLAPNGPESATHAYFLANPLSDDSLSLALDTDGFVVHP
jgi:hypothetical protein